MGVVIIVMIFFFLYFDRNDLFVPFGYMYITLDNNKINEVGYVSWT